MQISGVSMAAISVKNLPNNNSTVVVKQWLGISSPEDIIESLVMANLADVSLQIDGDFDELTRVAIIGSNDGTAYHKLSDKQGNKLVISKSGIYSLGDNVALLSAFLLGAGELTKVNITLHARRIA